MLRPLPASKTIMEYFDSVLEAGVCVEVFYIYFLAVPISRLDFESQYSDQRRLNKGDALLRLEPKR